MTGSSEKSEKDPGGHESRDANLRNVVLSGAGLFGVIGIGLLLSWGVYALTRALAVRPGATPMTFTTVDVLPPKPRLQQDPHADLVKLRAAEDSVLLTYGWVNKDSGLVRIPITRAMQLLAEKGLPVRQVDSARNQAGKPGTTSEVGRKQREMPVVSMGKREGNE